MKILSIPTLTLFAIFGAFFTLSSPTFGASHELLLQAQDLVHQAWNPGGKPPSNDKRTQLLNSALKLLQDDPYVGYQGHKAKALRYIHSALDEMAIGDPDNKVNDYLQDAVNQLGDALIDAN